MKEALSFIQIKCLSLLKLLAIFLLLANFMRAIFLVLFYEPASIAEFLLAFLIALRFDLATFAILFSPVLLTLFFLPKNKVIVILSAILFSVALSFFISDLFYYPHVGRRVGIEIFVLAQDFLGTVTMAVTEAWYMWLLFPFIVYALYRLLAQLLRTKQEISITWRKGLPLQFMAFVILVCLAIIAIRGGLQSRPLRPAMAFQNENVFLGNLSLNPIYTIVQALDKQDQLPIFTYDRSLMAKNIDNYLQIGPGQDSQYIFQRKTTFQSHGQKKNVVLVILESWSAQDLFVFGHKLNATPFFTELTRKGKLYTQFYATGQRSISSLPSIIASIPSIHGSVISMSSFQHNRQRSLGSIFKSLGYETYFTYAAKKTSMGFYSYAKANGFTHIITKDDFSNDTKLFDGTWGIFDHVSFSYTAKLIKEKKKPFFAVLYSLHPHPPFHLPPGFNYYKDIPRRQFFNALRYSDYAVKKLVVALKDIKNTIFLFTADHAYGDKKNLARFQIPLLVYEPGSSQAKKDSILGSQLDIMPTILDMLRLPVTHSAMGKSLLRGGARRILLDQDQIMLFSDGKQVVRFNRDSFNSAFSYSTEESLTTQQTKTLQRQYKSYISAISFALKENRISKNN